LAPTGLQDRVDKEISELSELVVLPCDTEDIKGKGQFAVVGEIIEERSEKKGCIIVAVERRVVLQHEDRFAAGLGQIGVSGGGRHSYPLFWARRRMGRDGNNGVKWIFVGHVI